MGGPGTGSVKFGQHLGDVHPTLIPQEHADPTIGIQVLFSGAEGARRPAVLLLVLLLAVLVAVWAYFYYPCRRRFMHRFTLEASNPAPPIPSDR